jgi:hypothetical protein
MGVFKQFLASDIIVSPLEVNKSFTFTGADQLTGSSVSIDRFLGTNLSGTLFDPTTDPITGQVSTQYQRLIYNSVQELYYSNYINTSSSYGAPYASASIIPGSDPSGDVLSGSASSAGKFFNYLQTDLTFAKYFPTASNSTVGVISIPSRLYGNYIQPNSFIMIAPSGTITDDGQGNLLYNNYICGNIFYPHGIAVITSDGVVGGTSAYGSGTYGSSTYGGGTDASFLLNFVTASNVTVSFSSSLTIFETQYKCTLRENEFNATLNPSIQSGSDGTVYSFATSPEFGPYITTVGLYDEDQNLLAVGKLAQPVPSSPTTDTTILINIDR